jgi:putative intracellular protease/amidase
MKVLIVATSHDQMGDSDRLTGLWLEELAEPYYIFTFAGALVTLASPMGGEVPLDPQSESLIMSNSTIRRFQKDPVAISLMEDSVSLETLKADDFDMVFLTGGHGAMWDFPDNRPLKRLLEDFNLQDKPIGAISHGVAALVQLENNSGGSLMKGRKLTAFSDSEEQSSGLTAVVPFLLESALTALGASFVKGTNYVSHVVTDGNLITGQNPSSSKEVARQMLACLKMSTHRRSMDALK